MRHEEFKIGMEFTADGSLSGRWRCTDVGTRAIVAIQLEPGNDPSWCDGPPYAVAEFVFDEDDIVACKKCEEIIGANGASTQETTSRIHQSSFPASNGNTSAGPLPATGTN